MSAQMLFSHAFAIISGQESLRRLGDKIHHWLRVLRRERIMAFAFLGDDRDFPAKFFVSFFDLLRIVSSNYSFYICWFCVND